MLLEACDWPLFESTLSAPIGLAFQSKRLTRKDFRLLCPPATLHRRSRPFLWLERVYLRTLHNKKNAHAFAHGGGSAVCRLLGYCPQTDPLLPLMTVLETLLFFGGLKGVGLEQPREAGEKKPEAAAMPSDPVLILV